MDKPTTDRFAEWDLENMRVSLPINETQVLIVKNAVKNKRKIWWKLKVWDGKKGQIRS